MKSNEKVELIHQTVQKLIQEKKKKKKKKASSHDDQLLLSTLLSQLESLKEEEEEEEEEEGEEEEVAEQSSECETTQVEETKGEDADQINGGGDEIGAEEIVNEIKKVKKQNLITHCLLSVMIVLTVAWQFSEVALIFKVKDGLSHPFKSVGSMLTGILKPLQHKPPQNNGDDSEKQQQQQHHHIDALKLPELPHVHMDFSDLHLNGENH